MRVDVTAQVAGSYRESEQPTICPNVGINYRYLLAGLRLISTDWSGVHV